MDKIGKALCIGNFAFALGILLPMVLVSFPSTFQELSRLPRMDAFSPGALGFLLLYLCLILLSALATYLLLNGAKGKLIELAAFFLGLLAIAACAFSPYWLGYLCVAQNLFALSVIVGDLITKSGRHSP